MLPLVEEGGPTFFEFRLEVEALTQSNFFIQKIWCLTWPQGLENIAPNLEGHLCLSGAMPHAFITLFYLFMLAPINIQSDLRVPMLLCTRNFCKHMLTSS
jgi:hypothetical protein